ncbi:hypothetical protein [Daejeonella sp.]|uniref:hypothetical protein n=1 Tax=Daejeonella sp. TaxID=2805397 RepID=UPI0030BAD86C
MKTSSLFKIHSIAFTLCCICAFAGNAEVKESNREAKQPGLEKENDPLTFPAEKIYLQLDNKVYTTDQTVWFKAIVTRASDHTSSGISGVLHVDLIDQNELIVEKKLIRLVGGIGDGFFQLNSNYTDGHYQIRAYTEWNRNFGPDFFFKEYITVYSDGTVVEPNPIQSVTLTGAGNQRRIKATINPSVIDSMHTRDLALFIAADDQRDTIKVSRSSKNNYELDYAVPPGANFITLKLNTKNASGYSRTIVMDENFLDLQFFPESGEMVHGLPNVLGFKALDSSGNGIKVTGEILNSKGQVLTTFASNELGMGALLLADVDSAQRYTARVTQLKDKAQVKYPLPAAAAKGNLLTVKKIRARIYLKVTSNYLTGDSLVVKASCRGQAYFDFKGRLKEGVWELFLPADILPEGVISFTLMTLDRTPLAERLYFNERPEDRIQLSVNADKGTYTQRELTKLAISTTDNDGKPINAGLSVMVLNTGDLGNSQNLRENILSYFLLSSELRGRIENPGSYFTDKISRLQDLDALLLTQGWRKYKYSKPPGTITFKPEQTIAVSGYVGAALAQKKERSGVALSMVIFGPRSGAQTQTTDSLGRFSFDLDEQEGHTVDVLVQSNSKTGKQKDYTMILDKKTSPPASFDQILTIQKPDSIERAYVSKSMDRKKADDAYIRSKSGVALQEVVVRETALSPQKKLVEDKYGKARTVISGDDIRSKEPKWAYGLYSVLMFNFPEVRVRQYPNLLYASIPNSELTLVVVDGIPVNFQEYGTISSIPPSEVKSFELIPYAKNFRNLFCETIPENCGPYAPTTGNVIAIYTYAGKGIYGVTRPVGLSRHTIPVFAAPAEFYAPKYEHLTPEDWKKPDKRTLVHWQPQLWTNKLGNAAISFYNADNIGPLSVIVEAISADGRIGYKEVKLVVKKRE